MKELVHLTRRLVMADQALTFKKIRQLRKDGRKGRGKPAPATL